MNKDKLKEILSIQSESYNQFRMFAYIIRQCNKYGWHYFVNEGNIYVTKGDASIYPCIVAHMDTVHEIVDDLSVLEVGHCLTGFNRYTMSQTGIGGDDKVGIFIALQCLEYLPYCKCVFFRDEEVGCDGSYIAEMSFFKNCSFVLQCDRRGNNDFITNASGVVLSGVDFQNDVKPIIKHYGYKFNNGAMTDVMALKENGLNIPCANISCGYYNPHSLNEYVNIQDVENCLLMVVDIAKILGNIKYKHKAQKYTAPSKWWKQTIKNEAYCIDCWNKPALQNGLCADCFKWYQKEYGF